MAEDKPNLEASEENRPSPIDPNEAAEAVKEVKEAMAILPKKRLGCLGLLTKYAILLLGLLTLFVYWNFLRTPRLKISKETSHITEPRTSDGARVDYFAALEQELCPPELKTDDNGYRLIVRALGDVPENLQEKRGKGAIEARAAQVYERLGLDPAIEPTMTYSEYYGILREYCAAKGHDEKEVDKEVDELADKVLEPWTLDDLPMMAPWLEKNGPALDLVGEAVRRPAFFFPLVGPNEEATLGGDVTFVALGEMQRTRSFARMLLARANYRIGVGDIDGAINDVVTCERLGRHVESQGTILASLVGIAVRGMAASVGVAANRQSLPTKEQLQRFVEELDAIPLRPNTDRMWLAERYYTLDSLQAMAFGEGSLAALFSAWGAIEQYKPGIAAHLPVDWNVIMRRVNGYYDNLYDNLDKDENEVLCPPKRLSLGNLFIGVRSRRMADFVISLYMPAMSGVP